MDAIRLLVRTHALGSRDVKPESIARFQVLGRVAVGMVLLSISSFTAGSTPVFFAGIAFTGAVSENSGNLPLAAAAIAEIGTTELNQQLIAALRATPSQHLDFDFEGLGRLDGTTKTLGMAVSLDRETVLVDRVATDYRLLYELSAQLLFFDYDSMRVRTAFPIIIQRIDVKDSEPSADELGAFARQALNGEGSTTLVAQTAARLADLRLPAPSSRSLQLVEVSLDSPADAPDRVSQLVNSGALGHELSKIVSAASGVGLLPHQPGQAVGGAIAARFSDGRVYNLTVPTPDYELRVAIRGFRHRVLKETPGFRQDLLGVYFDVHALEPMLNTYYVQHSYRHGATRTVPASQAAYDRDSAFYEALLSGFASFVSSSIEGPESWIRQQADPRAAANGAREFAELLEYCR